MNFWADIGIPKFAAVAEMINRLYSANEDMASTSKHTCCFHFSVFVGVCKMLGSGKCLSKET